MKKRYRVYCVDAKGRGDWSDLLTEEQFLQLCKDTPKSIEGFYVEEILNKEEVKAYLEQFKC